MSILLKSWLLGFAISIPIGPIAVLIIRRSIKSGWLQGFCTGLGASMADMVFVSAALFSSQIISSFITEMRPWIEIFLGASILLIGIYLVFYNSSKTSHNALKSQTNLFTCALSAFLTGLSNVAMYFAYLGLLTWMNITLQANHSHFFPLVLAGIFFGTLSWWFLLTTIAYHVGATGANRWIERMDDFLGYFLMLIGIIILIKWFHSIVM